jgi:hypothetical protein
MHTLPSAIIAVVAPFAPLFSARVWRHAQVLLAGTILAPAHRTVAAALRATGLAQTKQFHRYHRVLSHARWSGPGTGRVLLHLLAAAFTPDGPLVFGVDETPERRGRVEQAAPDADRDREPDEDLDARREAARASGQELNQSHGETRRAAPDRPCRFHRGSGLGRPRGEQEGRVGDRVQRLGQQTRGGPLAVGVHIGLHGRALRADMV